MEILGKTMMEWRDRDKVMRVRRETEGPRDGGEEGQRERAGREKGGGEGGGGFLVLS